jgi:hypothetical protein
VEITPELRAAIREEIANVVMPSVRGVGGAASFPGPMGGGQGALMVLPPGGIGPWPEPTEWWVEAAAFLASLDPEEVEREALMVADLSLGGTRAILGYLVGLLQGQREAVGA